jgi:hypothetical protein
MSATTNVMFGKDRTIMDCIFDGMMEFEMETGHEPTRLLLGHMKFFAFEDAVQKKFPLIETEKVVGKTNKDYMGLEVWRRTEPGMTIE